MSEEADFQKVQKRITDGNNTPNLFRSIFVEELFVLLVPLGLYVCKQRAAFMRMLASYSSLFSGFL